MFLCLCCLEEVKGLSLEGAKFWMNVFTEQEAKMELTSICGVRSVQYVDNRSSLINFTTYTLNHHRSFCIDSISIGNHNHAS